MISEVILGLALFGQGTAKDSIDCGTMEQYRELYYDFYPRLYIKDTSIQVSDDAYIRTRKVIFKTKTECIDLANEFSSKQFVYASKSFPKMDFSRPNSLEDFMEYIFGAISAAKYRSIPAHIAYSKEEGVAGERFFIVSISTEKVTDNRWGAFEEFVYPKFECLSVDELGNFSMGGEKRCSETLKRHFRYIQKENKLKE